MVHLTRRQLLRMAGAAFALSTAGVTLSACGSSDEPSANPNAAGTELEKLTAMMPFPLYLAFIADVAGKSGGYMKDAGIDLDLQFARSAPQALQQLLAGDVDVIRGNALSTMQAVQQQKAPLKIIGIPVQDVLYTVVSAADAPVRALDDLVGTTVGLPSLGGNAEQVLDILLRNKGIDPAAVKRVATGNEAAAFTFVQQAKVRALFTTVEATAGIRGAYPDEVSVLSLAGINPLLGNALVTTEKVLAEREDALVAYLSGLRRSMRAVHDQSRFAELTPIIRKEWDLPALDDPERSKPVLAAITSLWYVAGEDNLLRSVKERWETGVASFEELGLVEAGTVPTDYYTNRLLDQAPE